MALRNKLGIVVVVALASSALGMPQLASAAPPGSVGAPPGDGPARVTLLDGAPANAQAPQAVLGTRTGPATAIVGDRPQRPKVEPEVSRAAARGERVAVVVRLRDQVNLATAAATARQAARTGGDPARSNAVVNALKAKASATQGRVRSLLDRAGATKVTPFWVFNGFAATIPASAVSQLAAHPDVESVSLDEEIRLPDAEPSQPRLPTWGLEKVRATTVWGEYGFTGEGVVVGIMDGGVDAGHPALAGSYRGRDGDHAHSWFAATGENYATPGDGHGHGTHVAGTAVGGAPGETTGVAPDAEWIAAKIFRDSGTTSTSIIHAGFQWMLAPGGDPSKAPDVVNNSWGSNATYSTEFWEDVNAWVAAGIFPNFSAGNAGPAPGTVGSPASFPQAFAVGAADVNDQLAPFSSRGSATWDGVEHVKPQLSAPGQDIFSAWPLALDPDGYNTISGTSMAAPHVTGVIALLLEAEPDLSVDAIRELLTSTARVEPHMGQVPNNEYGAGIVDAHKAITAARFSGTVSGTIRGPEGPIAASVSVPDLGVSTQSDPVTGFYELRLHEGTWTVQISAYGFVGRTETVTVTVDSQRTFDATLAAAALHTLSGTVSGSDGALADAAVRVAGTPLAPVFTDTAGRYSIQVAAGTYDVSAQVTGYQRDSRAVPINGDTTADFTLAPVASGSVPQWREYQNNPRRNGVSAEQLAPEALNQRWQVDLPGQVMFSSPVVSDGRVYLTTDAGRLFALNADSGVTLWSFSAGAFLRTTPVVADGRLYFGGGEDGVFYALDAVSGQPLWTYPTGDRLTYTTATVAGGVVYFGTGWGEGSGGWVYALDAQTGALRWRTFIGPQVFFGPTVAAGTVFAGSYDARRLVALDAATGAEKWALTRQSDSFAAAPTYHDGVLYAGTNDFDTGVGSILAVDAATGALRWEASGHGDAAGNSPVVYGEVVLAGSNQNNWVAAYDRATGVRKWVSPVGSAVSNAQLVADGVVIGGSQLDHRVWALDAYTGELRWDTEVSNNVLSAPAFADGKLVVAARDGQVTMLEAPGTVTGVVRDANGDPVAATVRLAQTDASAATDPATGRYTLAHRPGTYRLEVNGYGFKPYSTDVTLRSGRTVTADATLVAGGYGSLAGFVTDQSGAPLAGVAVALAGTPLPPVTSDDNGWYEFGNIAEGSYELAATRDGYVPFSAQVSVPVGDRARRDITLVQYQIAVTGDYQGELTRVLTQAGYTVETTTIAAVADRVGSYQLIVANGAQDDPGKEVFTRFLTNADAAGTSVIFLDTWGINYGSLLHLAQYTGDPAKTGSGDGDGEVSVISRADTPLTAGLPQGTRVPLLSADREYAWFTEYSGRSVGDLYVGDVGVAGSAIGYRPRTQGSVHVLLSAHGVSPWTGPGNGWQPAAHTVFSNAVAYALQASFGTVRGQITDAASGSPVAATVTVAETGERATAGAAGSYSLLLPAGSYTLRFERGGYVTRELPVTVADRQTITADVALVASGLGAISGTVRSGGQPIAGATVSVVGTELTTITGDDGAFTVNNVPGGSYQLRTSATGFVPSTMDGVTVVDGEVTQVAVELRKALRVAVIGDSRDVIDNELSAFLNANDMVATPTGWGALDQLDSYDLVVFSNPTDPGRAAFLAALDKLDAAGISGIFIEGAFSSEGGVRLLRSHLGNPTGRDFESSAGDPQYHAVDPNHPLFAGVGNPAQILLGDRWAGYFTGYTGFKLADFGTTETGVVGVGAAYEPRTPTSVRLLLSGLSVSVLSSPSDGWSEDGKQIFRNALRWAADPGLGAVRVRVTDSSGQPVAAATAKVVQTGVSANAAANGTFTLAHPAGTYTMEVKAFGYAAHTREVTFTAGRVDELSITLDRSPGGDILGLVTDRETGAPLAGATVRLEGQPRSAVTGEDGGFRLSVVESGEYVLRAEAAGHVRQLFRGVVVTSGADTTVNLSLRPSPKIAVIDDYQGRAQAYLTEWGYQVENLTWTETPRVDAYDLILANLASFPNQDPGAAGWAAFNDAVNRADVPVVWLDQFGRGAIRWLTKYDGDPQVRGEGRSHGTVDAKILADHPLVEGFDAGANVPLVKSGAEYSFFSGYSGTTVAELVTGSQGVRGGAIGYRGRTAQSVDVLLSTLSISTYGYPPVGAQAGLSWTPQAETLLHNALNYALDAPPLAAEARGTVRSSATGQPIGSAVTVVETGDTVSGRAGDGSYLVPLQPGTWTLRVSAFGHATEARTVTVAAGGEATVDLTLTADPSGQLRGTVTSAGGSPVGGATVSVEGTPLSATTAADGTYVFASVPARSYTVRVQAGGFGVRRLPVTVESGQTVTLDVTLSPSRPVAVAGDSQGTVGALLTANGYEVRQWSWADVQNHIPDLASVELVILNGSGSSPTNAELGPFLDAAAQAGVSVIMAGQWGTGAIRAARSLRGDPATVTDGFTGNGIGITFRPATEHPIFAGFEVGAPIVLMREPGGGSQQWQWFGGYSGTTIAAIGNESTGDLGGGVGYRFTSPTSVEVLLEGLQAGTYGRPGERWTADATQIYLNAVQWALDATQARIAGRVTSDGNAVAGAEVRAVEAGVATTTGADGQFLLGVPDGVHTVRVTAFGYEPFETTVTVSVGQTVELPVALVAVPRGAVSGTVRDAAGTPVAGARITASGPQNATAVSAADGTFTVAGLLPGEYALRIEADHFMTGTAEATVVAGQAAAVPVVLTRNDTAVLGDVAGALTAFLLRNGVAAEEIGWDAAVGDYSLVVVNGGAPSKVQFDALVAAADAAGTSLLFTGTWGVDNGGIRLLERYGDGVVTVGGQGYRDGAVGLTGFDAAHPVFAGVPDPAGILAPDSFWSDLSGYAGLYLANLSVERRTGPAGVAVAYDFRTAHSMHLLVSIGGVSGLIGPGYGWTPGTERLMLNAIGWARTAIQPLPAAPAVDTPAALVATPAVTLTGTAEFRATVTVTREGTAIATATPGRDGRFSVSVPLAEGSNRLVVTATNKAGASPPAEVTVVRDSTGPVLSWSPADRAGFFTSAVTVSGTVHDGPAGVASVEVNGVPVALGPGGAFAQSIALVEGENTLTVVATDALGNKTTEIRTVRLFPYTAGWRVPTPDTGAFVVFLKIADAAGQPVQGRSAELVIRDGTGAVVWQQPMAWRPWEKDYRATVPRINPGTYAVWATVDIDGWQVTLAGGELRRV